MRVTVGTWYIDGAKKGGFLVRCLKPILRPPTEISDVQVFTREQPIIQFSKFGNKGGIDETYCAACKAEYQLFNLSSSQLTYFLPGMFFK